MMKYKVGDRVRVIPNLKTLKDYEVENSSITIGATRDMVERRGTIVTIKGYVFDNAYTIEGDKAQRNWAFSMFEPLSAAMVCTSLL